MVSKCTIGASKGGFLLILEMDGNLKESRVTIKKTKIRVIAQPLKHLVYEWHREVVLAREGV